MGAGSILLLANPQSYRLAAFKRAASSVDAQIWIGLDTPAGFATSDASVIPLNFSDPRLSVEQIRNRLDGSRLSAVIAVDDSTAELAEEIRVVLGLQSNGTESIVAGRDKAVMRRKFAEARLPGPQVVALAPDDEPLPYCREIGYPVVIKPTRLNGSRGVIRADNDEEAQLAFARAARIVLSEGFSSDERCLLIESFIPGFEVAVEGVMTDGQFAMLALFDKPDPLDGPFFEETIYVTPSRLSPDTQQAIGEMTERMANAIGLRYGPVHAELRVNDEGVWPIELAARSIGGQCSTVLEFGAGMSLEEIILRHALGQDIRSAGMKSGAVGVMMIPIPGSGLLRGVNGLDRARNVAGVTGLEISAPLNAPIVALPDGASYLGFIFAQGESPEIVEATLRAAHQCLDIEIAPMLRLDAV